MSTCACCAGPWSWDTYPVLSNGAPVYLCADCIRKAQENRTFARSISQAPDWTRNLTACYLMLSTTGPTGKWPYYGQRGKSNG